MATQGCPCGHRVLKLARTIADLAEAAQVEPARVIEAIQNHQVERRVT